MRPSARHHHKPAAQSGAGSSEYFRARSRALGAGPRLFAAAAFASRGERSPVSGPNPTLLSNYFPGYSVAWPGVFVGFVYGLAAGEDRELCDRWLHRGGSLRFAPRAVVVHCHVLGLRSFLRQRFGCGRGACLSHRVRFGRGEGMRVEPAARNGPDFEPLAMGRR
jgi:hypothetical protein